MPSFPAAATSTAWPKATASASSSTCGAAIAAEGHVDHVRALLHGVVDAFGDVGRGQHAGVLRGLDRHDLHVVGHAHAADAVAGLGRDDAGHVGAVAVVVLGIAVVW